MRMLNLRWWIVAAGVVVLAAKAIPLSGQQAAANPDVLNALLVEVRGLRAAMEQMASTGPRVQLAVARLQLQEQRVNTLLRRLDTVREQIAAVEREATDMRNRLAGLEEDAKQSENPDVRREAADMVVAIKAKMQQFATELQRLAAEEAEMSGMVAAEQSRWTDINNRIDELERALTRNAGR